MRLSRHLTCATLSLALAACGAREPAPAGGGAPAPPAPVVIGTGQLGFADSPAPSFHKPIRLAPFGADSILVADIYNHALREVGADGSVRTLAGAPDRKGHVDGPAAQAAFASPHGVAVAPDGRIAVAEAENHTIRLLTPTADGQGFEVSTLAGVPGESGLREGPAHQALFSSPHAVAFRADGSLVVADIGNARVREIAGGQVRTLAGGEATEPSFTYPMDLCLDGEGRAVVIDAATGLLMRVSKTGEVETLPLESPLATPHGVCLGPDGEVLVAVMGDHTVVAIDEAGGVRRIFGRGEAGTDPEGLYKPAAVLVHAGLLWIADLDNHQIKTLPYPAQ